MGFEEENIDPLERVLGKWRLLKLKVMKCSKVKQRKVTVSIEFEDKGCHLVVKREEHVNRTVLP